MKVLHYGLSSNYGGIESYLIKISKLIDKSEFEFSFLDMTTDGLPYKKEIEELGMKIFRITPRSVSFKKNKLELNKLFEANNFDILHYHANTLSYITPIEVALKKNCSVILHSRSSNAPDSYLTKLLHNYNYLKLPMHKINKIAVSNEAGKWLFRKNTFVILNNGIKIDQFRFNKIDRQKYREKLNMQKEFIIGHIAAFTYAKNHEFVIKIFFEFQKKHKNSKLVLIGDGVKKEDINKLIIKNHLQDKVVVLNTTSNVSSYLSSFDVMIFPSFYEGYPNIILEAQTSGLPTLISNTITKEIILTENCIALPIRSEEIWVNELKKLYEKEQKFYDRKSQGDIIKKLGKDVSEEIKLIENMYRKVCSDEL